LRFKGLVCGVQGLGFRVWGIGFRAQGLGFAWGSGSEAGSYLRLIDFVYHSTLGVRVIQKKRRRFAWGGGKEALGQNVAIGVEEQHPKWLQGLSRLELLQMFHFIWIIIMGLSLSVKETW